MTPAAVSSTALFIEMASRPRHPYGDGATGAMKVVRTRPAKRREH